MLSSLILFVGRTLTDVNCNSHRDPHKFLTSCFPRAPASASSAAAAYPSVLSKFMRSVDALCFEERPDYAGMRDLLREEEEDDDGEDEVFVDLEIREAIQQDYLGLKTASILAPKPARRAI